MNYQDSFFCEADENPLDEIMDKESVEFQRIASQESPLDDSLAVINEAIKGNCTRINEKRNAQGIHKFLDGINHFDKYYPFSENETILVRHYYPTEFPHHGTLPLFLFIHGGGWCYSSIENRNTLCSLFSKTYKVEVSSINYSLSPEAECGKAINECYKVYYELANNHQNRKIFLSGDSSGGNLAAGLIHKINQMKETRIPTSLLLFYPVIDLVNDYPSYHRFESGYGLELSMMRKFIDAYVPDPEKRKDPLFSPIFGDVHNFPPTFILTSQFDILRNEGYAFAKKLHKSNVPVRYICMETAVHGFLSKSQMKRLNEIGQQHITDYMNFFK